MLRIFKKTCSQNNTIRENRKKNMKSRCVEGIELGQVSSDDNKDSTLEPNHGEPSIAGTLDGYLNKEEIHGKPSIAGPEAGTVTGVHMNNKLSHGKPSIAAPGFCDTKSSLTSNLSRSEEAGLKSLRKRVESKELVITETDKSKRFSVLKYDQYFESGAKHTKDDIELCWDQVHVIQRVVNDHCKWL